MEYNIKDIKLSEQGKRQLDWAEAHMPALMYIRKQISGKKPLNGLKIAAMLHVTKESGVLVRTLRAAGAIVGITASNPLSTQDDVAAALAEEGNGVFAWKGQTNDDYYECIKAVLKIKPDIIIDDGADLHAELHQKYKGLKIIGGTEETTTGVNRLKGLEADNELRYPIIAVNNAHTKYLFDNRYGTGQSAIDGIIRATNLFIAGKCAVVVGYGWVGRGIAMRLKGLGARVIVTEVVPYKALEALMEGFEVMPMAGAAKRGDIFVTATGNKGVIRAEHIKEMKENAVMANAGHFDVEIDVKGLEKIKKSKKEIRPYLTEYTLSNGKKVYLLAEGRLVNLGAAEGHPSEVMDMSMSNQALSAIYLAEHAGKLKPIVYDVFPEIDEKIAKLKLSALGVSIDAMTKEQEEYAKQWRYGT